MNIVSVKTKPYLDQNLGTSGLRKKIAVVEQPHYVENFIQSVFDVLEDFEGQTLIIGGDGRYYNDIALQKIIKIAIANQFGRIIIGQNGILSTPAVSHIITKYNAIGGFILSASHNPAGPNGDFGIKYNNKNGAPAPKELTDKFTEKTKTINRFWIADIPDVNVSEIGEQVFASTTVQIIDSVADYTAYMQQIFDFEEIKKLFSNGFSFVFDAMNAVTGPYAVHIFENLLGAPKGSVIRATPLPDFGGIHPEPNLIYAKDLVDKMSQKDSPNFGAASDGDGDRYMVLGKSFPINPSDSLAILAQYLDIIPFYKGRVVGVARSMPTSFSVDDITKEKGINLYQTPTGWKYFGNLLDAGKIALCGEESFGASSFHIREKDGIWAVLCWLSIIAKTKKTPQQLVEDLWQKNGRVFTLSCTYDIPDKNKADITIQNLIQKLPTLVGQKIQDETIEQASVFNYTDPITNEIIENQGIYIDFKNDTRIIFRLSGTVTSGASFKIYLNKRISNPDKYQENPVNILDNLLSIALEISELKSLTGIEKPSMMT